MKTKFTAFILFISLIIQAQTTYYINPARKNSNNGSVSSSWLTLAYACTKARVTGDTIHVNAGTYIETAQSVLSAVVNIKGEGNSSYVKAGSALTQVILLSSSAGTNGNQVIKGIFIDCDLLARSAIRIYGRSNVRIYYCTIAKTMRYGVTFADQTGRGHTTAPTIWATGNRFYNNQMINCGRDLWSEKYTQWQTDAALDISGQDGMIVEYNNIDNASGGRYAYGIKG
jgi:hypothetical protein